MRVAIRTGSTFGRSLVENGKLVGDHSGLAIVRRLLKLWPNPILVVGEYEATGETDEFEFRTERQLDVNNTVIVNMDVIDSLDLYRRLRRDTWRLNPKIVNLVWWNTSEFQDKIERHELAMSTALFPTFCNSERTELEIRGLIGRYCTPAHLSHAVVEHQNLGIEMPTGLPPQVWAENGFPTVMYPAMWLFHRKRPDLWLEVVGAVAHRVKLIGKMRLHEKELTVSRMDVMREGRPWLELGPILPTRSDWWMEAAAGDVFLATSSDESYGLQYLELLWAGQIGVFPRRPWAENILPPGYPWLYVGQAQAETMLYYVLTKPAEALEAMERSFGDDSANWLARHHSKNDFDSALQGFMERAYPELATEEQG